MKLADLLQDLIVYQLVGSDDVVITGITHDSRNVSSDNLFICLRGFTVDGHQFAAQAVARGATALVVEERLDIAVPQVIVPDTRRAMAVLASRFYGHPSQRVRVIGVTGTNGKTTTTYLIHHILTSWGKVTGLIGTIERRCGDRVWEMKNTTPEALELQHYIYEMHTLGAEYVIMEVSSHALDLGRVRGCRYRSAVFTNLSQDHLDYHQTMVRYKEAKCLLFSQLGNSYAEDDAAYAIINADDDVSGDVINRTSAQVVTYGIKCEADVRAVNIRLKSDGTSFDVDAFFGKFSLDVKLVGEFSVYNLLAAITVCYLEGVPLDVIKTSLENVTGVNGRFERIEAGQPFTVIVDYAHTPDSLENVLKTVQEFVEGRVLCVVGCGGDRDRTKRPLMARIAATYSDKAFFTSDNPRSEEPETIINDMLAGLDGIETEKYTTIIDRREAIHRAIEAANSADVVIIAGKGHETYQEIKGTRIHFDDREVAREAIHARYGLS